MKVLILITVGWLVVGCREIGAEKVVKAFDDVKVTGTKIQAEVNVADALAVKLGAILPGDNEIKVQHGGQLRRLIVTTPKTCLLYTSPSPRDRQKSRMPSSA